MSRAGRLLGALALCFTWSACATGESIDDEGSGNGGASAGTGGSSVGTGSTSWANGGGSGGSSNGGTSAGGGTTGGGSGGVGGSGGGTGATGGTAATGGSGGSGGTGGSGGSGGFGGTGGTGGGGTGGTGGNASCTTTTTCFAATSFGSVTGDEGPKTITKAGTGATFVKARVTEDNSSVLGEEIKVAIKLTSPSASDFDVKVYVNTGSDTSPCGGSPYANGNNGGIGTSDNVAIAWGEGAVANGGDEGRDVVFEIVHKSGPCDASATWQLAVTGDP